MIDERSPSPLSKSYGNSAVESWPPSGIISMVFSPDCGVLVTSVVPSDSSNTELPVGAAVIVHKTLVLLPLFTFVPPLASTDVPPDASQ